MNKQEIAAVVFLFLLLLGWGFFNRHQLAPDAKPTRQIPVSANASNSAPARVGIAMPVPAPVSAPPPAPSVEPAPPTPVRTHAMEEQRIVWSVPGADLTISSWSGGIVSARLTNYWASLAKTESVQLDFTDHPALSFVGLPLLAARDDFRVSLSKDGDKTSARIEANTEQGLRLERVLTVDGPYRVKVSDTFANKGTAAIALPEYGLAVGPMKHLQGETAVQGMSYLGIDTFSAHGGEGITYWDRKFAGLFGQRSSFLSCRQADLSGMPLEVVRRAGEPVLWAAVKNKFFVQILTPENGGSDCELRVARDMVTSNRYNVGVVGATLMLAGKTIQPGETVTIESHYYVGPKDYALLKVLAVHQADVMDFGKLKPFCIVLLRTLNALHRFVWPNYGVAVILLTILVKVVFWPVTHKSTESMKAMQKIQPLVAEIKKKYKDKPQKIQQETMALYKEHKVNPMMGCLPILVQIPVFIALFTVLRSAVELRFSPFLWIGDLSEAENLFAGLLPIPLNILPLLMTATTIWQQKLMPQTGDAQQQKIMMFMPIVMLFIFYSMASGLVLYWTVSQFLSIVQLLWQRWRSRGEPPLKR